MDLSFKGINARDAGRLAQELELTLVQAGIPRDALSFRPASSESMDFGSILGIDLPTILNVASGLGSFAAAVLGFVRKREVALFIKTENGSVEVPPNGVDLDELKRTLTELYAKK
jgi:hypothetical protein